MTAIGIFSTVRDLHGHVVAAELRRRDGVEARVVATDDVLHTGGLHFRNGTAPALLRAFDGSMIRVEDLSVVWWRRVNQPLRLESSLDVVTEEFVNNEWRSAIAGLMHARFRGAWVNHPSQDAIAGNKVVQLEAASKAGFRVPETIVSQDPVEVRDFCEAQGGTLVAKKLMGTARRPLATLELGIADLQDDRAIAVAPSIYQERVRGTRHLRVNCFGDRIMATLITSPWLDWRRDLSVPFEACDLDLETERKLLALLSDLGLRMAIVDLMVDEKSDLIWLELNTQGQFLFAEALSKTDLTGPCADFLLDEARVSR